MFSVTRVAASLAIFGLLSSPIGIQPPPPRAGEFQDTLISSYKAPRPSASQVQASINNIDVYVGG